MKLIKPSQISGEIMTLIEESDEKLILISPYCDFNKWNKFKKSFKMINQESIDLEFYVRKGIDKTINEVEKLGFTPIEIENLHTKLYLNEKYGIVSSMNLLEYSDSNSLDIAYKTQTEEEYQELFDYYKRYILIHKAEEQNAYNFESKFDFFDCIVEEIQKRIDTSFKIYNDEEKIIVQGPNKYTFHISNEYGKNIINACGILTGTQYDQLKGKKKMNLQKNMKIPFHLSRQKGQYDLIWHHSQNSLKSSGLNFIEKIDFEIITPIIIDFVSEIEKYKNELGKPVW